MKSKAVSGIMRTLLLFGILALAFETPLVKASGTIYIRADGSVEGTTHISTVDNVTYYFTGNINESIIVERDNIEVDGNSYTLQGTGSGSGICLTGRINVTIKNMEIKAFYYGIWLKDSSNNSISENNITNNTYGIRLYSSSNNTISGNNITNNEPGIRLYSSSNNTISGNNITENEYGIRLSSSSNNTISGNNITNNGGGILLNSSSYNTISGNNITNNGCGIFLENFSNDNTISRNTITNNNLFGIEFSSSSNNIISGNTVTNNTYGIRIGLSSNTNLITGNTITNNELGICLVSWKTNDNTISGNNITNNKIGISLWASSNNKFYHNNFVDNIEQVHIESYPNTWDDGYPSGGNYWSDYAGVDVKSGPNQDQPSSDGIGDTAYVIDSNNTDHYPLMYPGGSPPPTSYSLTIYTLPTGVTFTVDGVSCTTPWSGTYSEGTLVSLVMPETHGEYAWSYWLGGETSRIKTVTMDTDNMLTGVFTGPVGGKATPINIPMDKPETPTLWIWLTTIFLSLAFAVVYVKKRKRERKVKI